MAKIRFLSQADVARVLDMPTAIRVVREAFKAMARGQTVMPPKVYLPLPGGSDFRAMPAYLAAPAACGSAARTAGPPATEVTGPAVHPAAGRRRRGTAARRRSARRSAS